MPGPSNSHPGAIYDTPVSVGEAVEVEIAGRWLWADVILVESRWRRATRLDGSRGGSFRIDDRVVLRVGETGEIIRTTPWLMARQSIYRGVQGSFF